MTPTNQTVLRDVISTAVDEGFRLYAELEDASLGDSITDSVLTAVQPAVLPPHADQAAVCVCGHDYLTPAAAREVIGRYQEAVKREAADRNAVLNAAAQHLYIALFPAVYNDLGQKAAEGVNRAVSELRRLAAEAPEPATQAEGPLRCPRCGEDITDYDEDDRVFRTGDERPYCSGECVIATHRDVIARVREVLSFVEEVIALSGPGVARHSVRAIAERLRAAVPAVGQTGTEAVEPYVFTTQITVNFLPEASSYAHAFKTTVEYEGQNWWTVHHGGWRLSRDGHWDYEPRPSERDDEWIVEHRFDLDTALDRAKNAASLLTVNGATVADALAQLDAQAAEVQQPATDGVVPPPALTELGRLRAQVEVLQQDADRDRGLAKVGARCMREGRQGLIEEGRLVIEGWRFALSVALGLGTDTPSDAIHERTKDLHQPAANPSEPSVATGPGVVAYRSHDGRQLRCPIHAPDRSLIGLDWSALTELDVEGDASTCTEPDCGVNVLIAEQQDEVVETDEEPQTNNRRTVNGAER